jgi:hypothetical protein
MNVIHIFSHFFMRVLKVFVLLLKNEGTYMIAMVITYVGCQEWLHRANVIQLTVNTP